MRRYQNKQQGFGIAAMLFVFIILVIVGIAGAYVWHVWSSKSTHTAKIIESESSPNIHQQQKATSAATTPTIPAGWKTYCDQYGGVCFSYPPDRKFQVAGSEASPNPSRPGVAIISLDYFGNNVAYTPDMPAPHFDSAGCASTGCFFTTINATDDPLFPSTKIVEGVFQSGNFANPEYCLMSDSLFSEYGLMDGKTVKISTIFRCLFVNAKSSNHINLSLSLIADSDNLSDATDLLQYSSYVKISEMIIQSARPQ